MDFLIKLTLILGFLSPGAWAQSSGLSVTWNVGDQPSPELIKTWTLDEISKLKPLSTREKDARDGKMVRWRGITLKSLVEEALKAVPADQKAQIDLIILKSQDGVKQALIPRWFIVRYSVLLATARDGAKDLGEVGPVYSVVQWNSKPKALEEGVPLESFFVPGVKSIELTNYKKHYSGLYLKRRTDPAAMRGEKIFVQSCISCHASGVGPSVQTISGKERIARAASHPQTRGYAKLSDRDFKALISYIDAHDAENPQAQASR